ncbi:flagellar assembly protein A [Massilia sp. DWR3-1-1]|uniref:flagellar assembly protein A n=1 Tax=Massilia sp. DWR3-1-1 TaxID=2804559 RepID=UPI003CE8082F
MSTVSPASTSQYPPIGGLDALGLEHCIYRRDDGVYADPTALGQAFLAAFEHVMRGNFYFPGLDYGLLQQALYGIGPALPQHVDGASMLRLARTVSPFDLTRKALYKAVKVANGQAEYSFEAPAAGEPVVALDIDEFIADMWSKGIRSGLDIDAIGEGIAGMAAHRSAFVTVARRTAPQAGEDARIIEVSQEIHRSDAPRQLANGKLDLMAFQNRFPQIKAGVRLLQKVHARAGVAGVEVSGARIAAPPPADVDLAAMVGDGTGVVVDADGEFLVALRTGYLDVDPASGKISIGDKIISRDGVSSRTTGNLQLTGDYEEFGEVQEKRVIEGEGITIHGDVYGHVISRGGAIVLNRNLVGGAAINANGAIRIVGMASNALIQSRQGDVIIARADHCIISGARVKVEHAVNCEIIGDEVRVGHAEGCAIAARRVIAERVGPRKQSEMLVFALRPDSGEIDKVIGLMRARVEQFAAVAASRKAEMDAMTGQPEVRKYVMLASRIRKKELTLTAEQLPQFQKMALAVGPALKAIAKVSLEVKAADTEREAGQALVDQLGEQRRSCESAAQVEISAVDGDTIVRTMKYDPNGGAPHDATAKDIKARLRGSGAGGALIFVGATGTVAWSS